MFGMRKRILILSNHFINLFALRRELIQRLISDGYEMYISLPQDEQNQYFADLGCRILETPLSRRGMNPFQDAGLIFRYIKIMRAVRPNIVFTYTIKPNIYGGIVCRIFKTPYLSNITGLGTSIHNAGLLQKISLLLYRMGLKGAGCVFYQNTANKAFMEQYGVYGQFSRLLPGSGVNLAANPFTEYPSEESGIRFLTVGRIMRDKGIDELLACAKTVHAKHPNVQFDLVGDYDDSAYQEKLKRAEAEHYLHFLGYRTDVPDLIARHHCIVHPSYHEGMSNVLLEAAALGRPVIATNIPGCKEVFEEGVSGFGVQARSAEALTAAVERFLSLSHAEKVEMGVQGRQKVEREFDRALVIQAYLEELQKIEGKSVNELV